MNNSIKPKVQLSICLWARDQQCSTKKKTIVSVPRVVETVNIPQTKYSCYTTWFLTNYYHVSTCDEYTAKNTCKITTQADKKYLLNKTYSLQNTAFKFNPSIYNGMLYVPIKKN